MDETWTFEMCRAWVDSLENGRLAASVFREIAWDTPPENHGTLVALVLERMHDT